MWDLTRASGRAPLLPRRPYLSLQPSAAGHDVRQLIADRQHIPSCYDRPSSFTQQIPTILRPCGRVAGGRQSKIDANSWRATCLSLLPVVSLPLCWKHREKDKNGKVARPLSLVGGRAAQPASQPSGRGAACRKWFVSAAHMSRATAGGPPPTGT